jgi:hypothetical protein
MADHQALGPCGVHAEVTEVTAGQTGGVTIAHCNSVERFPGASLVQPGCY